MTIYSRTLILGFVDVASPSPELCDDSAPSSIGDEIDWVEPNLTSFSDNMARQYVLTYEYAKLDLLYTISTVYN